MKTRWRSTLLTGALGLGALTLSSGGAAAATACTADAVQSLGVSGVTIVSATSVSGTPSFCDVAGTLVTHGQGAPDGLAHFEIQLPMNWNHKLLVEGMGGFAGFSGFPGVPIIAFSAANGVDQANALTKGYAVAITDTGHTGEGFNAQDTTGIVTDARWALKADGSPDEAKLADYYFRATHDVTVAAKSLAEGFFGQGKIRHAYFDGCSNGGRQALVEATRFPDDFDGIIAGDPFMSVRAIAGGAHISSQIVTPNGFIPFTALAGIDQATLAECDALDGVKDGLIQNPAACSFRTQSLLCKGGATTGCLTQDQITSLNAYFEGSRDDDGTVVYPGFAISDLGGLDGAAAWTNGFFLPGQALPGENGATFNPGAAEPWGDMGFVNAPLGWQFEDHGMKFLVERNANFDPRDFAPLPAPISDAELNLFDARTEAGDGDDPRNFDPFIDKNKKLLIYHGLSDPALTAFRSVMLYEALAARQGGFRELQENVRLFGVPGMHHCSGGPGPNTFDTLTALEGWVEDNVPPDSIVATKFVNDTPSQGVSRTMPLCKFPEEAKFIGNAAKAMTAELNNAENWTCSPNDERMLETGLNGIDAGLGLPQAAEFERDRR